jgi:hypothetical protein
MKDLNGEVIVSGSVKGRNGCRLVENTEYPRRVVRDQILRREWSGEERRGVERSGEEWNGK